ncbi:hypothetical protein ARMGADRAFT_1083653 [Armillaria gallica]|uniref:Uncharacterized protein n=1 Tax=Armillaria gallica TaxID=47427 RepID=A0A2H3D332_ARMGA|nr:hypothetical protein ARMGADRAFT_1083653 [Armillaria gallica]
MNSGRGGRFLIDKEEIRPLSHVLIPAYSEWWRTWAGDNNRGEKKISPIFPATNVDCYSSLPAGSMLVQGQREESSEDAIIPVLVTVDNRHGSGVVICV